MRTVLILVGVAALSGALVAQQTPPKIPAGTPAASQNEPAATKSQASGAKSTAAATAAWPSYCSADAGFCVKYPADWKKLPDVLQGAGVVVAKAQPGVAEDLWPQITAAVTLMPEEPEGKEAPTFDDVLNVVLDSVEPGTEKQTLQRTQSSADGLPAQLVKLKFAVAGNKPWIEEGLFIDGDDAIYSVVLRASPEQLAAVEPVFLQMARTWRQYAAPTKPAAPKVANPPNPATPASPK